MPEKTANPQAQLPSELEERVRKMTTAAFDAFVEVDSAGRVVNWNAHAKRIFGWSRTEMLGRRICETVVPERFLKEYQQVFRSFLDDPEGPKGNRFEQMTALHKDGNEIIVEFAPSRMQCADGYHILTYVRDITERKRHEKAQQDNQDGYQTVIDLIADPYFESDLPGNYTFVNDAFCQMYGTSKDALIGARSSDFLTPENTKMLYDLYSNVLTTGKPGRLEYERKEKGRPSRFVEQSVGIKKDRDGRPVGWVCIVRDVTARKMSEQELARAKEAAEAANISKSTFLATMSHEIRTPMNGVLGMTELVLDSELTAEQREHLGLVKLSAESLLSIINDVLDFSKIEAGKLDFESISFDLRESLGETMKALSFRAHEKGLELVYDVHPEVSEGVIGDPTRVRQIMINLVGNAIKFTERGEVLVTVEQESQDNDSEFLHFSVSDTGIGIPIDQQDKVFEPFAQADGTMTRRFGGTGLGLTICMRLVEKMGGRMWVESEPGKGSTFHFTARLALQKSPSERPAPLPPEQLHNLPVLIVDDNSTNRRVLQGLVSRWGMKPTAVDGGRLALQAMEIAKNIGRAFPLVLLDGQMPELDGFALAEHIQKNPELAGATILMLTSAGHKGDGARCRELGISAYLVKPIRPGELLDAICRVLGKSTPELARPLITRHTLREDQRRLRILLAEDNQVNQTLAVRLLEKRGHVVTVAEDGKAALAALEAGPFDLVLMDIQMPEMDGLAATAAIREKEKFAGGHIPIIAMTAHALVGDQERCLAAGMDAFVSKPIRTSELFETIDRTMSSFTPAEANR